MHLEKYLTSDDPIEQRIAKGLDWIQTTLGAKFIDDAIAAQQKIRGKTLPEMFDTISPGAAANLFGWHLYICHTYFFDVTNYDTNAGCRIIPTIAALGERTPLLAKMPGATDRLKEVADGKADFEKTLFEFLVAASYADAGWQPELLKPSGTGKTPDIHATVAGKDVYVECKRLSKNSGYAQAERDRWQAFVKPVGEFLRDTRLPILLDIVFHRELRTLREDLLANVVVPKLKLAVPGTIIDSKELTVVLRLVDQQPLQEVLKKVNLKTNGTQILDLLFGRYDPSRGYHTLFSGTFDKRHPLFIETIEYAAGLSWSCDAPRALAAKARDIRNRLREAVDQLPVGHPGVVHIAVESYDGPIVERLRNQKIAKTLSALARSKQLEVVHIHLVTFESPPDEAWAVEETVFSTSFAAGKGKTIEEHENTPHRLKRNHVWSFDTKVSTFKPFEGF